MLNSLLNWFQGYVILYLKGCSPERFMNLCRNRMLFLWDIKQVEGGYACKMRISSFFKIPPIARKTRTIPHIVKRCGFPFLLHRYRKRKMFFAGILLCIALVYSFSFFIWDIQISGEYTHTDEALLKYLNRLNISTGMLKRKVDCQALETNIREQYKDIGWVSAEIRGTRLLLKISETNEVEEARTSSAPRHIVAACDGTVISIVTREGTPMVSKGDLVKKGDILISGILDVMGDGDLILKKEVVCADGDIRLNTTQKYFSSFPMTQKVKEFTGEKSVGFSLFYLNNKIIKINPFKTYEKYDIIKDMNPFKLSEDFYLPLILHRMEYKEYQFVQRTYTKSEAETMAKQELSRFIAKLIEKQSIVKANHVKIHISKKNCVSAGELQIEKNGISYQSVEDNEWRDTKVDEHRGDNR